MGYNIEILLYIYIYVCVCETFSKRLEFQLLPSHYTNTYIFKLAEGLINELTLPHTQSTSGLWGKNDSRLVTYYNYLLKNNNKSLTAKTSTII